METFFDQVETWFSRDTTKRWEHALQLFFENNYTLDEIQGLGKDTVRVTFQGYPALLLHLDIRLDEEGLAFELASYKLGDVDSYLTPDQLEEVLEKKQDGKRSFKLK